MKTRLLLLLLLFTSFTFSQSKLEKIDEIVKEANKNSQLEILAHELMDQIGTRLTGTPQMLQAHEWVVNKYQSWNINSENELPKQFISYMNFIEEELETPIKIISVGPDRKQTIFR